MLTKICNFLKKNLLFFSLFFFFQILSAEETKWIIACEPFVNSGLDTSISLALSELIPNQILDIWKKERYAAFRLMKNLQELLFRQKMTGFHFSFNWNLQFGIGMPWFFSMEQICL